MNKISFYYHLINLQLKYSNLNEEDKFLINKIKDKIFNFQIKNFQGDGEKYISFSFLEDENFDQWIIGKDNIQLKGDLLFKNNKIIKYLFLMGNNCYLDYKKNYEKKFILRTILDSGQDNQNKENKEETLLEKIIKLNLNNDEKIFFDFIKKIITDGKTNIYFSELTDRFNFKLKKPSLKETWEIHSGNHTAYYDQTVLLFKNKMAANYLFSLAKQTINNDLQKKLIEKRKLLLQNNQTLGAPFIQKQIEKNINVGNKKDNFKI